MTQIAVVDSLGERTQRFYARLAGFVLLWLMINGLGSAFILSHITGSGTFTETAIRIGASERLYRVALSSLVIENLSGGLLAFALYVTLKPVNQRWYMPKPARVKAGAPASAARTTRRQ